MKARYLIDTDWVIEYFHGNKAIVERLSSSPLGSQSRSSRSRNSMTASTTRPILKRVSTPSSYFSKTSPLSASTRKRASSSVANAAACGKRRGRSVTSTSSSVSPRAGTGLSYFPTTDATSRCLRTCSSSQWRSSASSHEPPAGLSVRRLFSLCSKELEEDEIEVSDDARWHGGSRRRGGIHRWPAGCLVRSGYRAAGHSSLHTPGLVPRLHCGRWSPRNTSRGLRPRSVLASASSAALGPLACE